MVFGADKRKPEMTTHRGAESVTEPTLPRGFYVTLCGVWAFGEEIRFPPEPALCKACQKAQLKADGWVTVRPKRRKKEKVTP